MREQVPSPKAPRCELCRKQVGGLEHCYLTVTGTSPGLGSVTLRWVNVRCLACRACSEEWLRYHRITLLILFHSLAVMALALFGGGLLSVLWSDKAGGAWMALGFLLVFPADLIASLCMLPGRVQRGCRRFLGRERDQRLRQALGIRRWGLTRKIFPRRTIPSGEGFLELSRLLAGK